MKDMNQLYNELKNFNNINADFYEQGVKIGVNKYKQLCNSYDLRMDMEEVISSIGLSITKALKTYRNNSNASFVTYYSNIVKNDLINSSKVERRYHNHKEDNITVYGEMEEDIPKIEYFISFECEDDKSFEMISYLNDILEKGNIKETDYIIVVGILLGYKQNEIAQKLNISKQGVNNRIKRFVNKKWFKDFEKKFL